MIDEQSFDATYGKGAFARLRRMLQESTLPLAQIGREFGLTRQRVSQLAQLFGINSRRRQRERTNRRPLCLVNRGVEYPSTTRQVLAELERRGIPVAPHYTSFGRRRRYVYKNLTKVFVKGVPCKIGCRNTRKDDRFATFPLSAEMRKAKAVVLGLRHGPKFRLYVIPVTKLKKLKQINIPVTGAYIGTSRKPIWNWTRFEDAWHLLREGSPKHSSLSNRGG